MCTYFSLRGKLRVFAVLDFHAMAFLLTHPAYLLMGSCGALEIYTQTNSYRYQAEKNAMLTVSHGNLSVM